MEGEGGVWGEVKRGWGEEGVGGGRGEGGERMHKSRNSIKQQMVQASSRQKGPKQRPALLLLVLIQPSYLT